jgi:hypothetical protein
MRQDMYKIIVERPRNWKGNDQPATRLRDDIDGPTRLGIRAGYGHRVLNENLAPLRRFLRGQIGRPWNKVFSEICAGIDGRNTVQQHIRQHIDDFIAINVEIRADGELIDLGRSVRFFGAAESLSQELYVDPRTGLIRLNKAYRSWRKRDAESREREQVAIARRRRPVDDHTLLMLLDGQWFSVAIEALPEAHRTYSPTEGWRSWTDTAESRYDVLLRRKVSRAKHDDCADCRRLYGSHVYAVSKRQLSKRELKSHRLR